MARKRMIDPSIWESEQVMSLDSDLFKLYIYLINHADDEGRLHVNPLLICSRCYPLRTDLTSEDVQKSIQHLDNIELIVYYEVAGKTYLCHPNWRRYQTINKPTPSRLPPPPESYRTTTVELPEDYGSDTVGLLPNRIEEKRKEVKRTEGGVSDEYGSPRWPENSLEIATWLAFEKTYGGVMPDIERNRDAVDKIVFMARQRGDPELIIKGMMEKLLELKKTDNSRGGFWKRQPFLPTTLVSLWARVWEQAKLDAEEKAEAEGVDDVVF